MTNLDRYAACVNAYARALEDLMDAAAELGDRPESHPAEVLEFQRITLHRRLDDVIDDHALKYPSPRRLIVRSHRYIDIKIPTEWENAA